MLIPRLRTLALSLAAALAIAGAAESTTREIPAEDVRATSERFDGPRESGSLRAPAAPASAAALTATQPTLSQVPGGRSAGFDLRNPSLGAIDAPAAPFGIRRPGTDPGSTRPGHGLAQRDRLLRNGAISSFATSLPPPPHA